MKVAKNISDGIDFGRSLGGGVVVVVGTPPPKDLPKYIYICICFFMYVRA